MDQESRDANSLLLELDRGLQSQNIGDQGEAVVRFTNLFQRFPLPILINSACLKLAEAFRCGSNFIRIQICELFERNQCHLNKIYNIDDFFRNLFTVTTSNDPVARSITLLTLGNIAPIVSNYKSIHHCISSSFETTVDCELKATIACAARYVKHSSEFACNIYPKIVSIIDSNDSPTDVKIRALSVLDHAFYNANDAMTVRFFLIDVIQRTKWKNLICTCLTLSTKIAYTSLSHIMPQIELLLKTFLNESEPVIKFNALQNLKFLAENSPHIWESSHVDPLISHLEINVMENGLNNDDKYSINILSILCKLLTCDCNFISQQEKNRIFQQCFKLSIKASNISITSMAFEILTVMAEENWHKSAKNSLEYQSSQIATNTFKAVQSFLDEPPSFSTKFDSSDIKQQVKQGYPTALKAIFRYIVKLCRLNPHHCQQLLKLMFAKVMHKDTNLIELCPYVTEMMCAILHLSSDSIITPENCLKLIKSRGHEMSEANLLNLCVLLFQTVCVTPGLNINEDTFVSSIPKLGLWFGYKVLRQAMRYGQYKIVGAILDEMQEYVTTDTTDFYFKSLARISKSEAILLQSKDIDANLKVALPLYEDAVSPLRATVGNTQTNFQLQFLCLRIRTLQAHSTLRQTCKIYDASPISYATLLNALSATRGSADPSLLRTGIIQQMHKIAKDFRQLSESYENLSLISFDCDNCTLDYIHLLKSSCIIMADAVDAIFQYGKNLPVISKLPLAFNNRTELALEYRELEATCNGLIELIKSEILRTGILTSNKSIENLIVLLKAFSTRILECRFVYPRYFFQPLQSTHIKLAITPQPTSPSSPISLILNYNLVLKVEGLIQRSFKTNSVIRSLSKLILSVTMSSNKPLEQTNGNLPLQIQSIAIPHNNYFTTEFLLPLKWAGLFNVDIHVSIIDQQERLWKTGPTERLSLSVS